MLNQLYKIFQHWSQNGSVYIGSDPHFCGSALDSDEIKMRKVFDYAPNEVIIDNYNKKVSKNDYLIILGDIGDPSLLAQLKCKNIVIIKGNHDRGNENYIPYCKEIYEGPLFINNKILLSHEPLHHDCWLNIHGHIHNQEELDRFKEEGKHFICVSANLHNYEPMNLGDLFKHQGEFKDFPSFSTIESVHRKTINRATERKRKKEIYKFETL